uniref:Transcriptional regulator, HxlR family n=1 Tax=Burkholderia sp. (strain CCGE1003) TaxID=640512 RepID=E1THM6_BURSG
MPHDKPMLPRTCPVARTVDLIGDKWTLMILRDVFNSVHRFGDFQRNLGVARNILSGRLARLVEEEILAMRPASDGSNYQEYVLTPKGESLFAVIVALQQWGERYLFSRGERRSRRVDIVTNKQLPLMSPRSSDGRVVSRADTVVKADS